MLGYRDTGLAVYGLGTLLLHNYWVTSVLQILISGPIGALFAVVVTLFYGDLKGCTEQSSTTLNDTN